MSGKVVDICSPWYLTADAANRVADLIDGIPCGGDGYQLSPETLAELRQAAVLLQQAIGPLRRSYAREASGYEQWAENQEVRP